MKRRAAHLVIAFLLGCAVLELVIAAFAYRERIDDEDWESLREALSRRPQQEPVLLATTWLGPRARMEVPRLRAWSSVAPPDLRARTRFHVIGVGGQNWSSELADDLEDVPMPDPISSENIGPFTITTYAHNQAARPISDALDGSRLVVTGETATCRGGAGSWRCGSGQIEIRTVEIDHRPRRCIAADVADGERVKITASKMRTGNVVRGHVGFDDFNARLRSDAPVLLTLSLDGVAMARFVVSDEQGWWPFALAVTPGEHDVTVELLVTTAGTWQPDGHTNRIRHVPCVEFRSFEEKRS